jgi:hypothetical protein
VHRAQRARRRQGRGCRPTGAFWRRCPQRLSGRGYCCHATDCQGYVEQVA